MKTSTVQARLAIADFIAFVALAACIALSVGLVLGGTVMLLAGHGG